MKKSPASPLSIFLFCTSPGSKERREGDPARRATVVTHSKSPHQPPTLELQIERGRWEELLEEGRQRFCPLHDEAQQRARGGQLVQAQTPFRFRVASGQVVKGWDQAVTQLSVGEKATTTFPANLAFGRTGLPGLIPPNQDLNVTLELVSIETDADVEAMLTGDDSFAVAE